MATLMMFMYNFGLSNEAVKAWSTGIHAAAADCYGAADASYPLARQLLKEATYLGVAAVGLREQGWQTPAPGYGHDGAGMINYAAQRTLYKGDYADDPTYFYYSYAGRDNVDLGDGLNPYNFELAFWLVMRVLPLAAINYCDDRGRHSAFSQFDNWSTAEFLIRSQIYTCEEAIKMMDVMVVPPWTTNADTYTGKPLLFVNAFSVGQGPRIEAMLAYLPESNDPHATQTSLKVMAEVYVRSGLAPKGMSAYQTYATMANLVGFACAPEKNIGLGASASQGICSCYEQLVTGGGDIITTITREGGRQTVKVRIVPADEAEICRLWNEPGARAAADAEALSRFEAKHYAPRRAPWNGGVSIFEDESSDDSDDDDAEVEDEDKGESSSESGGDDAPETVDARAPSEELTPALIRTIFYSLSLYADAEEGEVEAVLTAVGERVDALGPAGVRALHRELVRARGARGGRRTGGPANLGLVLDEDTYPSWHPESERFLERARAARVGLVEPVPREVPELRDDDGVLIYNASTSTGFDELRDQYRTDLAAGRARASLQKTQKKLAGSLEAMYPRDAEYSDGAGLASVDVGHRVDALYEDGRRRSKVWCAATVVSFDATTFTVHYDDGDDATLSFQMIRKRVPAPDVEFAAGDHVHADWKGHGTYYGATVRARRDDCTYNLEYDIVDGNIDYEEGVHADRVWP